MAEIKQFMLPDVGEGLTEADIVRWLVRPGDRVTVNQAIVEIETAKSLVELPSPFEGIVTDLLVPEGTTADVGTPIIAIRVGAADGEPGAGGAAAGAPAGAGTRAAAEADGSSAISAPPDEGAVEPGLHGSPAPKQERQSVLVGYGVKPGATRRRPRRAGAAGPRPAAPVPPTPPAAAVPPPPPAAPASPASAARAAGPPERVAVLAKPPVRKLAKELGVDLAALAGTGPAGSITREDVQAAAAGAAAVVGPGAPIAEPLPTGATGAALAAWPAAAPGLAPAPGAASGAGALPREERIPIRGVRKHTAAAVTASAFTAPHVTEFLQIDMTESMATTERLRSLPDFAGLRVSPLLLVARALLIAVRRHPMINSSWDEAAQEIVVRRYVNLGIAAATERGLVVPNVKDAHLLTLPELARSISELTEAARAGRSTPRDLSGGTITITNVGVFGVDAGTPILTPGEAAILAFGQVKDAPWVHQGQLAVRQVCTLALSFDHRIVDGDLGSAVLRDVGDMLTDPLRMLAWS